MIVRVCNKIKISYRFLTPKARRSFPKDDMKLSCPPEPSTNVVIIDNTVMNRRIVFFFIVVNLIMRFMVAKYQCYWSNNHVIVEDKNPSINKIDVSSIIDTFLKSKKMMGKKFF